MLRTSAQSGQKSLCLTRKAGVSRAVRAFAPPCNSNSQIAKMPITAGRSRTPSIRLALPKSKRPCATMLSKPTVEIIRPSETVTRLFQIDPFDTITTVTTAMNTSANLSGV